jgi:superfamily II DNA helicase RecQ
MSINEYIVLFNNMDVIYSNIAKVFSVNELAEFQQICLNSLYTGNNVFVSYKTGSGKSLCYEAFPLFCYLQGINKSIVVIIIEPLISIMDQQVKCLTDIGFTATYIGRDTEENDIRKQHEDALNYRISLQTTLYYDDQEILPIPECYLVLV